MKGSVEHFSVGTKRVAVYLPEQAASQRVPAIYLNLAKEEDWEGFLPALAREMGRRICPALLIVVEPTDWDFDFSPWPAPSLRPGQPPFPGGADARIRLMEERVKPAVDARYPTLPGPENTGIFGYSLGGLAALYALYTSRAFGMAGCLSGSLWYEGFVDFLRARQAPAGARIYLSLGRKEERSRNPYLSRIGACYQEAHELLRRQLGEERVRLVMHDGGHATEVDRRMLAGLMALLGEMRAAPGDCS